jgi:hypothetical protein
MHKQEIVIFKCVCCCTSKANGWNRHTVRKAVPAFSAFLARKSGERDASLKAFLASFGDQINALEVSTRNQRQISISRDDGFCLLGNITYAQ